MELKIDKSNWKKVKLGDVAFEYSKRINNPSESEFDRFVGSSNIGQWDFRVKSWETTDSVSSAMKLFEPNDYLLVILENALQEHILAVFVQETY